MTINGISGIGKYQPPQEPSLPEAQGGVPGGQPTFTECLNILFSKDENGSISPFVITTKHGNIGSGLIGSTVNFVSNDNINKLVAGEMGNPFNSGAQSGEISTFMKKV